MSTGRYELRSPNASFAGTRFGIEFKDGVGRTDDLMRAKAVCEPQSTEQTKFFTLIDTETGKQLYPVVDEEPDPKQDDGTKG